jgi:hypothetical protein
MGNLQEKLMDYFHANIFQFGHISYSNFSEKKIVWNIALQVK